MVVKLHSTSVGVEDHIGVLHVNVLRELVQVLRGVGAVFAFVTTLELFGLVSPVDFTSITSFSLEEFSGSAAHVSLAVSGCGMPIPFLFGPVCFLGHILFYHL